MPKMKSHSGAKKRFRFSGKGKLMRRKGFKGHLLTKKTAARKRRLRQAVEVDATMDRKIRRLLPYG